MSKKGFAFLVAMLLLCAALPALALPSPVTDCASAQEVWQQTGLLLPLSPDARDIAYSVIGGTVAQATFTYGDAAFTLRQEKTSSFANISGVYEDFDNQEPYEKYADYNCIGAFNDNTVIAWWFDSAHSASGSLCGSVGEAGNFEMMLYDVIAGLRRGVCYAGTASEGRESFTVDYPVVQAVDEALTAKLNDSMRQGLQAAIAACAPEARFELQIMSASFAGKVLTAEWYGTLFTPENPKGSFIIFTIHTDCDTGELAPLRSLTDTDKLAESTYPILLDSLVSQDWGDSDLDDEQRATLDVISLSDWKAMLQGADFPSEGGWPRAFSSWRDGGYYRDGNEEEWPCFLLYINEKLITLSAPFIQFDPGLTEALKIQ